MKENGNIIAFYSYKDYLSNFYPINFKHGGKIFKNSEQAVMWRKAMLFGATDIANQILKTERPLDAKILGRSKEINFNEQVWIKLRQKIYFEVLFDKFNQNKRLRDSLINTGNKILVEASPYDDIWGVKLSENDKAIFDQKQWNGQNLLGKVLMKVREALIIMDNNEYKDIKIVKKGRL